MEKFTREQLEQMSRAEHAKIYNELTGSTIKEFNKKSVGITRILEEQETPGMRKPRTKSAPKAPSKKTPRTKGAGRAPKALNYPALKGAPLVKIREGGRREKLIALLAKGSGATLSEAAAHIRVTQEKCREIIRVLNWYVGYGVEESSTGRIRLFT